MPAELRQTPLSQTPRVVDDVEQFEPAATQLPLTQQPRPSHELPSQQGSPGAPHDLHVPPEHDSSLPVQKLADERLLEPAQQVCPSPPQAPHPPKALDEHVPLRAPPHAAPAATHLPPAQQAAPLQS